MEFKPLSHIHVLTYPERSQDVFNLYPSIFFSYLFNIESDDNTDSVFRFVFEQIKVPPFSLTILLNTGSSAEDFQSQWFEKLCLMLCHSSYLKVDNKHIIPLYYKSGDSKNFTEKCSSELQKQGFSNLLFFEIHENATPSFIFFGEDVREEKFTDWYLKALVESQDILNVFIDGNDLNAIRQFLSLRSAAENELKSTNALAYQLISQRQIDFSKISKYKLDNKRLHENISSKEAYIDFILGKYKDNNGDVKDYNEIMKIKKFYHNEYEILPGWYKKFGHLIKVIMGKRTFRSLFNDNVKKYKD